MGKIASVRLTDHFERFIEEQTASGRYASADEVIEAGLALLEDRRHESDAEPLDFGPGPIWTREALEAAIREGEESGDPQEVDFTRLFEEVEAELRAERATTR